MQLTESLAVQILHLLCEVEWADLQIVGELQTCYMFVHVCFHPKTILPQSMLKKTKSAF